MVTAGSAAVFEDSVGSFESTTIDLLADDGVTGTRILGGKIGNVGEFPHQAFFAYGRGRKIVSCGASIIHPLLLLTAAHCVSGNVNPEIVEAITGEHDRRWYDGTEQSHYVRSIIIHEHFNASTLDNDIAILVLQKRIILNDFRKVIRVAQPYQRLPGGAYVSGWGRTLHSFWSSTLQKAWVRFHDTQACRDSWVKARMNVTENMVCAGDNKKDACRGDSGGPLTCSDENGQSYLCGIVSWGGSCDLKHLIYSKPGVYVDVRKYHGWIQKHMRVI